MNKCPCQNCTPETGRSLKCHANCKKYLKWKTEHDKRVAQSRTPHWYRWSGN